MIDLPERGAAPAAPRSTPEVRSYRFEFLGTGREYFRIWIVNIALSVVTLGIYSAWAKVRNKQYFYGSTIVDGSTFEYTANPINILKGRLIVFAALVLYTAVAQFFPLVEPVLSLALLPVLPWVINRALLFNARYSSYRNLSFFFAGRYWETFGVYVGLPIAAFLTFGIAWPYAVFRRRQLVAERSAYGRTHFRFDGDLGTVYMIYILTGLAVTGVIIALAVVFGLAGALGAGVLSGDAGSEEIAALFGGVLGTVAVIVIVIAVMLARSVVGTLVNNHVWTHTTLGSHRFGLELKPLEVFWIQISNLAMIVCTFGLAIPFAKVRVARYWMSRFSLYGAGDLHRFVAGERERLSATGEEFGDALDLDLGL